MPDDIELGEGRMDRRVSFRDRLTTSMIPRVHSRRSSTFDSIPNSRDWAMENQACGNLPPLTKDETQRQDCLISFIVGDNIIKGSLATACVWYARFLRYKFNSHWHLLAPVLVGIDDESTAPKQGDLVIVYKFVMTVARLLKTQTSLALSEIVDELDNELQLKQQLDGERAIPNQLVFAAIAWLSMLYEAVCKPDADKLEVTKTSTSSCGRRTSLSTRKIYTYSQGFDHVDRPFDYLLSNFGDLIPGPRILTSAERGDSGDLPTEDIKVQSVCFNTLHSVVGIKIEWVSSLALHLEIDSGKKTLKLFQYPSFCRMMASERKNGLLSRLINDHAANSCEDVNTPDIPVDEFFEEILLSYRLIFGLDDRSWRSFSRIKVTKEEQQAAGDIGMVWDPLLYTLCAKSPLSKDAQSIYEEIVASEPAKAYPCAEFPFFGRRLIALQEFVNQHQPQNVRSLLNDRRDVAAWYTLWSNQLLVFFATFTIFLMLLSLIFQIWQVLLAKEQLQQGFQQGSQ